MNANTLHLLVNIDTPDLERAIAFYTAAFQLSIGRRFGADGVELLGSSSPIYLLQKAQDTPASPNCPEMRRYTRHWTPVHLDFVVEVIEPAVTRALDAGATLEQPIRTSNWGKLALMADPFGNGFCLVQFLGRGYDEVAAAQGT